MKHLANKEPWQMTVEEYANQQAQKVSGQSVGKTKKMAKTYHAIQVRQAVKDGNPVPPEVLEDYPDLQYEKGFKEVFPKGVPTPTRKQMETNPVAKMIKGEEVADYVIGLGEDPDSPIIDQIKKEGFILKTLNIQDILNNDPHVAKVVKSELSEPFSYKNIDSPIVINSKGEVLDGEHRLQAKIKQGDTTINAYIGQAKRKRHLTKKESSFIDIVKGFSGDLEHQGIYGKENKQKALEMALNEILEGYRDLEEAKESVKTLRETEGVYYTARGLEVNADALEGAIKVKEGKHIGFKHLD